MMLYFEHILEWEEGTDIQAMDEFEEFYSGDTIKFLWHMEPIHHFWAPNGYHVMVDLRIPHEAVEWAMEEFGDSEDMMDAFWKELEIN